MSHTPLPTIRLSKQYTNATTTEWSVAADRPKDAICPAPPNHKQNQASEPFQCLKDGRPMRVLYLRGKLSLDVPSLSFLVHNHAE